MRAHHPREKHHFVQSLVWTFVALALVTLTAGHAAAQAVGQAATYLSQIDSDLTIRKISVIPVIDNVDGIYARPIESQIVTLVRESHRWDLVDATFNGSVPTATELEESPEKVQKLADGIDADAFFAAAASRGPNGLSLRLDLFLKKDGRLLAQEILTDHPRFEIPELREQVKSLYQKVVGKLPYDGLVLSRQGNRVTLNLGKSDGMAKDQTITAVQIISVTRHPRFGFIVSSEKEILGKIKILQVDETLSFGAIVAEKERGAIARFAKISGLNQVNYGEPESLSPGGNNTVTERPDAKLTFGKDPKEWLPVHPASFGEVGVAAGLGTYNISSAVSAPAGGLEGSSFFYPSLNLHGEVWLNPEWTVRAELSQGLVSISNPRSGSTPGTLTNIMSRYALMGQYNFLLRDDFFGPKIQVSAGFANYRMFIDSSTPISFTTMTISGFLIGLGGSFPVTDDKIWYAGAQFNYFLPPMTSISEEPVSSGANATPSVTEFNINGAKKIAENIRATAALSFAAYGASFSGAGTRTNGGKTETAASTSERHMIVSAGLVYMF